MRLVLVTGASGFLGYALTSRLLAQGVAVRALVRSPQRAESLHQLGAEVVLGDIRDPATLAATDGVDTVIHCAATIGPTSLSHDVFRSVNVDGTRNLVDGLKSSRTLQRFVHVSTVAVIGAIDPRTPATEETPCHPLDAYGETKLLGEQIVRGAARNGFPAVVARPMWIYGSKSRVTANLFHKIGRGKLPMVGPAQNTMQPVAIEDAITGLLKCATCAGIENRVYNIAGSEILTIRSMCETIAKSMGTNWPKLRVPLAAAIPLAVFSERVFPVLGITSPLTRQKLEFFLINNSYSIEQARVELDWIPQITFEQGTRAIAEDLKRETQNSVAG